MQDRSGTQECPEGLDYRQLRAWARSSEEGGPVPPGVLAHIGACVVCRPKWEFLRRTDPVVRKQFEAHVLSLAEQVTIQEIVFRPAVVPDVVVQPEWTGQIAAVMATPPRLAAINSLLQQPDMARIRDAKARLEPEFVVDIFDQVRSIPDENERLSNGDWVRALFEDRLKERKISQQRIMEALSKLSFSPQMEVLGDEMIEVAAIIPETAHATDPPLLTMVGGQAMFDAPHLRSLRATAGY